MKPTRSPYPPLFAAEAAEAGQIVQVEVHSAMGPYLLAGHYFRAGATMAKGARLEFDAVTGDVYVAEHSA